MNQVLKVLDPNFHLSKPVSGALASLALQIVALDVYSCPSSFIFLIRLMRPAVRCIAWLAKVKMMYHDEMHGPNMSTPCANPKTCLYRNNLICCTALYALEWTVSWHMLWYTLRLSSVSLSHVSIAIFSYDVWRAFKTIPQNLLMDARNALD